MYNLDFLEKSDLKQVAFKENKFCVEFAAFNLKALCNSHSSYK